MWPADPVGSRRKWLFQQQLICQTFWGGSAPPPPPPPPIIPNEHPKPPHKAMKEAGSVCCPVVATSSPQSGPSWHIFFSTTSLSMHQIRYAHCWLLAGSRSLHISSSCQILQLCGEALPLWPFPRQRLHLLFHHFRKVFALFYWWLRPISFGSLLLPKEATLDESKEAAGVDDLVQP